MVNIIMHGCNGRMGQMIAGLVEKDADVQIVAGVDVYDEGKNAFPVYKICGQYRVPKKAFHLWLEGEFEEEEE